MNKQHKTMQQKDCRQVAHAWPPCPPLPKKELPTRSHECITNAMAKPTPGALPMPVKLLPNWAMAGLLGSFVVGTYMWTMRSVAKDGMEKELDREAERIAATSAAATACK